MASYTNSVVVVVRHNKPQLVVPAQRTPSEIKQVSDIDDQEGLRMHLSLIMFYKSNSNNPITDDPAKLIKRAISEALVMYYPLAGRLIEGPNRKIEVDCNGEGVLFVEAEADVSLEELGDSIAPPCPFGKYFLQCHVHGSNDNILGSPLLLIQITRLSCGGFVFAVRMNHVVCDSFGLVQFLNMVATLARDPHNSLQLQRPIWKREIFNARVPPRVTCIHHEYEDVVYNIPNNDNMAHESFFFGPTQILSLRKQLPQNLKKCSTYEILSACLWKCRTIALGLNNPNEEEVVGISCFITAHGKMKVPNGYYGNAFVFPTALSKASLLCQNPLGYALELIREAKGRMSEEYVKSVADLMVLKGRPMYRTVGNFFVGDMTRVGFDRIDFGWGEPIYGGPVGAIPFISYLVRFKNSSTGENGIVVPILLPRLVMKRFILELKKITTDHEEIGNSTCSNGKRSVTGSRSML